MWVDSRPWSVFKVHLYSDPWSASVTFFISKKPLRSRLYRGFEPFFIFMFQLLSIPAFQSHCASSVWHLPTHSHHAMFWKVLWSNSAFCNGGQETQFVPYLTGQRIGSVVARNKANIVKKKVDQKLNIKRQSRLFYLWAQIIKPAIIKKNITPKSFSITHGVIIQWSRPKLIYPISRL